MSVLLFFDMDAPERRNRKKES